MHIVCKDFFWKKNQPILILFTICSLLPISAEEIEEARGPLFDDSELIASEQSPASDPIGWSLFRSRSSDNNCYTINFNNVSIIEYIRFISKISGINFIFQEQELNFNVTIVSEEPISLRNIVSALVQTLRIHNLNLLEQDNNLLITSNTSVNQIPAIISEENRHCKPDKAPIVTRVFRIKNANLSSLASIIRPMTSQSAMVEISNETKQLIITDVATNVDKIAILLASLDAPHSNLEIDVYHAKHLPATTLIDLAKQLVSPFAEGNTLIFVPQSETNSIFVVSTPYLIERTVEVLEDLDSKPKAISDVPLADERVFLYKIQMKTPEELIDALHEIGEDLERTGAPSFKLISALKNVKWVKDSNSLLFVTDAETEAKVQDLLRTLDTTSIGRNFYIYKIQQAGVEQIERSIDELAKSVKKSATDKELVDAIQSKKYIKETNSLIFTGTDEALKKLEDLLPTFDVGVAQFSPSSHFWLYTPQYLSGKELESALEDLKGSLDSSGLTDEGLLSAIDSMKWVPATNTLLFTGNPKALDNIQAMIRLIDIPAGSPSRIFIYAPKYVSKEQIEQALDELAERLDSKNLSDRNLATAIDSLAWISESQSFLFKADPATIDKIQGFLTDIDNPKEAEVAGHAFVLYNLKYASGELVIQHLEKIAKSLPDSDLNQKTILQTIEDITYLEDTNSLLLTGTQKSIDEVRALIEQFDVPQAKPASFEKTSFFIYKPQHMSASALQIALKETADDLKSSGLIDPNLLQSIETMRYVDTTNSIVFTGSKESLQKTQEIINLIDIPSPTGISLGEVSGHTFLIYKVQFATIPALINMLKDVASNLMKADPTGNRDLLKSIDSAKVIKETNSILFTGPASTLEKINGLLRQLDTPSGVPVGSEIERAVSTYIIYKPINVGGEELISIMADFEQNLAQSGVRDTALFATISNLKFIEKTGYILISGDQASIEKVQELMKKFDVPSVEEGVTALSRLETSFLIYKLHYHTGLEITTALKQIAQELTASEPSGGKSLITAINSLQWIKITNSMLATGNPEVLTQLKELIQNVDVPLRQVFIEILIIRTDVFNNQEFGLQWGGKVQYLTKFAGGVSNFPSPNSITNTPANTPLATPLAAVNATRTPLATDIPNPSGTSGGFDLGIIGDIILHKGRTFLSLGSLVNALQQDNDTVIVTNPKIIGQDNQQSNIFVGQNIPFVGSVVTTSAAINQQTASNIEYRDVGVNLTITPILGTDDIITLDIANDITEQIESSITGNVAGLTGLQTTHTSLSARVHVPNNHFVALSGMIRDERSHFKSGLPCLGGLPVIGAFFSNTNRGATKNNVIFFIRPSIIDSVEQFKKITKHQEELYKEQAVLPIVKEEFDQGIDIVKTPDDE